MITAVQSLVHQRLLYFAYLVAFDILCFFFFQAEDGIRDDLVTGVQTCALPICSSASIYNSVFPEIWNYISRPMSPLRRADCGGASGRVGRAGRRRAAPAFAGQDAAQARERRQGEYAVVPVVGDGELREAGAQRLEGDAGVGA